MSSCCAALPYSYCFASRPTHAFVVEYLGCIVNITYTVKISRFICSTYSVFSSSSKVLASPFNMSYQILLRLPVAWLLYSAVSLAINIRRARALKVPMAVILISLMSMLWIAC